jgi:hypothetical protein
MVVTLQGFVVLFSGAMAYVVAPAMGASVRLVAGRRSARGASADGTGASHG